MSEVARKNKDMPGVTGVSRIDSKAVIHEPIDFSFKDMLNLEGKYIFQAVYLKFYDALSFFDFNFQKLSNIIQDLHMVSLRKETTNI